MNLHFFVLTTKALQEQQWFQLVKKWSRRAKWKQILSILNPTSTYPSLKVVQTSMLMVTITILGEHHPIFRCGRYSSEYSEYTLWWLSLQFQPWTLPQAVKNHQENFLKRLTSVLALKRPKQKHKLLNPSFYEEALQGFVCLLRSWTAAWQLHHVWNITAFVCSCWMKCWWF